MLNRTEKIYKITLDLEQWKKLYYKHQKEYIRKRLLAIKYLSEGKSRLEVTQLVGCNYKTLTQWIDKYLQGGIEKLTEQITHQKPSRLNFQQKQELKKILMEQTPTDYGIEKYTWTGQVIGTIIRQKWGVELKDSRIYEIVQELKVSHRQVVRYSESTVRNSYTSRFDKL